MTAQPLTDEQLAAIQARVNTATGGTWRYKAYAGLGAHGVLGAANIPIGRLDFGAGDQADADREFVLAAHDDMAALLAEVQQHRERLAAIAQLASALQDYLPGDAWHLAHAIEQCARGEITPTEALKDDQ